MFSCVHVFYDLCAHVHAHSVEGTLSVTDHLYMALPSSSEKLSVPVYCNCNQTYTNCHSVIQRRSQPKSVKNKTATNKMEQRKRKLRVENHVM